MTTSPMDNSPEARHDRQADDLFNQGMRYLDRLNGTAPGTAEDDEEARADLIDGVLECADLLRKLERDDQADDLERDLGTKR